MLIVFSWVTHADQQGEVWIPYWQKTSEMTIARAGAAFVQHENYFYAIGGVDGKVFLNSIERASINQDGRLGKWEIVSHLPEARGFFSALIHQQRLYVVGGGNGPYGKNLLATVVSAPIDSSGLIGPWRNEKNAMLIPRRCAKIFVDKNRLFAVGGFGGTLLDTVESAPFEAQGELGEWGISPERLNTPRYVNELKQMDQLVFAIGGHHQSSGKGISSVEFIDLESPARWRQSVELKQGRYAFASAAINKKLIVMGGLSGAEYLDSTEYTTASDLIKDNPWKVGTSLPFKMANFSALGVANRVYIFGGSTRSRYLNDVWYAEVNSQGEIGYYGAESDLAEVKQKTSENEKDILPNQGMVLQVLTSNDYTYMEIKSEQGELWLAAPKNQIAVGASVKFSEGVSMSNFYSKSLKRRFASILFVATVIQINH